MAMINFASQHISISNIKNSPLYQQPVCYQQGYEYEETQPVNFCPEIPGLLATGGLIHDLSNMNYLAANGYKSVLSLTGGESLSIIADYNKKIPDKTNHITPDIIDLYHDRKLWEHIDGDSPDMFYYQARKRQLAEKINELPKPIYMHCYEGRETSVIAARRLVREAIKEGLI